VTVPTAPKTTATASTYWKLTVNAGWKPTSTAASTGPTRNAVLRTVSVLANPAASREGSVACLTTANVAPRPNDFQACASSNPTKIQSHGSTVTPATETAPRAGATSQTTNPSVESSPNRVSAYRDPSRSETAPPGYG